MTTKKLEDGSVVGLEKVAGAPLDIWRINKESVIFGKEKATGSEISELLNDINSEVKSSGTDKASDYTVKETVKTTGLNVF